MKPMDAHRMQVAHSFGRTLRRARRNAGLSQVELAARTELNRTFPSLLENGQRSPSLDTFLQMSEALKVNPKSLFAQFLEEYYRG